MYIYIYIIEYTFDNNLIIILKKIFTAPYKEPEFSGEE